VAQGGASAALHRRLSAAAWAVRSLGLTTDIETAGEILGIGRTKAYALAKAGLFPAKVIRVGRLYKVSVRRSLTCSASIRSGSDRRRADDLQLFTAIRRQAP
jgi:hypothetical protein